MLPKAPSARLSSPSEVRRVVVVARETAVAVAPETRPVVVARARVMPQRAPAAAAAEPAAGIVQQAVPTARDAATTMATLTQTGSATVMVTLTATGMGMAAAMALAAGEVCNERDLKDWAAVPVLEGPRERFRRKGQDRSGARRKRDREAWPRHSPPLRPLQRSKHTQRRSGRL